MYMSDNRLYVNIASHETASCFSSIYLTGIHYDVINDNQNVNMQIYPLTLAPYTCIRHNKAIGFISLLVNEIKNFSQHIFVFLLHVYNVN